MCSHVSPSCVAQRLGGLERVVPVLRHELRRPQDHLADFAGGHRRRAGVGVDDAHLHVGDRHADRPDLVGALHRVDAARHHPFGERVALDDARAGRRLELLLGLGHQRRRAREAQLDRAQVHLAGAHVGVVEDRGVERRHAVEERRLDALDRREQVVDVARVRHQRQRVGADERHRLHAHVGVDVEERQRQHDVVHPRLLGGLGPFVELQPRGHVVAVQADDALRRARRAAARQDHRAIVGPDRHRRPLAAVRAQHRPHPRVARLRRDAVAVFLLLQQREQQPQRRRQVLLDRGRDDRAHARCGPARA